MELTNNAIADLREQVNIAYDTIAEKGGEVPENRSLVNLPEAIGSIEQSTPAVEEKEVNFYDYKGNCIYSYTATEAMNLKELPPGPPDDEWVTFHSWSETLEAVNRGLPLDVGAYYDVIDELKEGGWNVIMEIYAYGTIGVGKNVQLIDWGDGEISDSFPATHTYQKSGTYIVKAKIYSGNILLSSDSDYTYQNFSVTRIHCTNNAYLSLCGSNALIYGDLLYYTHPNTADYAALYQTPSLTFLQCLVLKNRGKAGYPIHGSCRRTILPTGESLGMWNSNSNGDCMTYQRNLPYGLTVISTGQNRGVITKIPTTCKRMNINHVDNRSTCFMYTPIPPVLVSASASKLYIPIGSLSDYQNATNYGQATFIECIPTEINSFSITADDVSADATTTTIHVRANLSMKAWYDDTMVPRDLERDIISEPFEANTSSKPREIEVSFTMLGETRTCKIIQNGVLVVDEAESLSQDAINYISTEYGSDVMTALESYIETSNNPNGIRGAINLDPDIVCSLAEVGKTRWLVGDGKAYINLNFKATQNTTAKAKAKLLGKTSVNNYQAIFGARTADKVNGFDICFLYPELMYFDFSNASADNIQLGALGTEAEVELNKNGGWLNGTKVFNSSTTAFTTPSNVLLFGRTDNSTANARPFNGAISYTQFGGDVANHLLPFTRNGENGMLDILSGTFYPNANTEGAFTIQITDKE